MPFTFDMPFEFLKMDHSRTPSHLHVRGKDDFVTGVYTKNGASLLQLQGEGLLLNKAPKPVDLNLFLRLNQRWEVLQVVDSRGTPLFARNTKEGQQMIFRFMWNALCGQDHEHRDDCFSDIELVRVGSEKENDFNREGDGIYAHFLTPREVEEVFAHVIDNVRDRASLVRTTGTPGDEMDIPLETLWD